GVPGRMNLGQVLELHLGWAADRLGFRAITPVFDGAKETDIRAELMRAWAIDYIWKDVANRAFEWITQFDYTEEDLEDDDEVRKLYVYNWVRESGRYDLDMLADNQTYMRRVVMA